MIDNKTRNSVARAIAQTQEWAWGLDYDTCLEEDKIHARVVADAAITAYEAALWSDDMDAAPKEEAVLVAGGDVLYPTTMSAEEVGHGWCMDYQGGRHDDDVWYPTHWRHLPTMEAE